MKFAQIEFSNTADAAKALHGIMQRGRITGLADGPFIVPNPALAWLQEQNIPCRVLRWLNQDDVLQTLRNHLIVALRQVPSRHGTTLRENQAG